VVQGCWKNALIPSAFVESAVAGAVSQWTGATSGLSITKVGSGGDITLGFATGDHGDGYPFDGPSGVLAHAFYPAYGGDVHFDDAETWTTNGSGGFSFPAVALHELGHSLGLDHSFVAGAAMLPYYSGQAYLSEDDVLGIQELYAIRSGSPPAAPSYVSANSAWCMGWHDVSWPAVAGATSYRLEFSPVSNFAYGGMIYAGSSTFVSIEVGDVWYLRARACNAGGCSGYSGVAQARYHYGPCL
jgi:Matrixin